MKIMSFMISGGWISLLGRGACSSMVGYLCCRRSTGVRLGCRVLLRVLVIVWSVRLAPIHLKFLLRSREFGDPGCVVPGEPQCLD